MPEKLKVKNGVHHDVIMEAKEGKTGKLSEESTEKLKREHIIKWLTDRAVDAGFTIDEKSLY